MSVTIVSTLFAPSQSTVSENASISDSTTSGEDFASLLLGQLAPTMPESAPDNTVQMDFPADYVPGDPASVLAALGSVTQKPVVRTDTSLPDVGKINNTAADVLSELQLKTSTGPGPKTEGKAESMSTGPALNGPLSGDDQPARFAVPVLVAPSAEPIMAKTLSADALVNDMPELPGNTLANAQNFLINRDVSLPLSTPIRDHSWSVDFAQKIVWLATSDKQSAQLTLNPPHMGPIEISLNLDKVSASATFVSANADVRDAIETALPRLREMFASAGIELGQTNVSAESFRQQPGNGEGQRSSSRWVADHAILGADSAGSLSARAFSDKYGNGLVDIFA